MPAVNEELGASPRGGPVVGGCASEQQPDPFVALNGKRELEGVPRALAGRVAPCTALELDERPRVAGADREVDAADRPGGERDGPLRGEVRVIGPTDGETPRHRRACGLQMRLLVDRGQAAL